MTNTGRGLPPDTASTQNPNRWQYPSATRTCQREIFREKLTSAAAYFSHEMRLRSSRTIANSHGIDREGARIQVFDKTGAFKKNIFLKRRRADLPGHGQPWWIRFSLDKAQRYMYVSDGRDEVVWTVDRQTGETLSGFGRPGHMAGEFTFLHTITMNSKGDLFTGETIGGRRVQKFRAVAN